MKALLRRDESMIRIAIPMFTNDILLVRIYFMTKVFIFIRIPQILRLMGLNINEDNRL